MIVWGPGLSVVTVIAAPLPSAPSRSDVHWIRALRLPLSASLAAPAKVTGAPGLLTAAGAGAVTMTVGAVSGSSVRRSCGFFAPSRLWYRTQSRFVLSRAKSYTPSAPSAGVTSRSTTCPGLIAVRRVASGVPTTAGRVL